MGQNGGRRLGAGRKKGVLVGPKQGTISKELAREVLRQRVLRDLEPMVRAQVMHAQGISHLMLRQSDGTFKRADNIEDIENALNSGNPNNYYLFTKDPSVQAFTDLMNRALDKPKEQEQDIRHEGTLTIRIEKPW